MRLGSGIQEFEPHDVWYTRTVSKYFQNKIKYEDDFEITDNLSP